MKRGELPAIVATSSLELGHRHGRGRPGGADRGAALGCVRHAAHRARRPHGRRGVARASSSPSIAATCWRARRRPRPHDRRARSRRRSIPRNPLDVLAQQIVAIASMDPIDVDELYALVRRAAPFAELPRSSFEGVLDMLSGRYPSDEFAELRPARHLGSRRRAGSGRARARGASRSSTPARFPIAASTASSSPARRGRAEPPRRRAGRGDGVRVAHRGRVPARRLVLADRGDHPRPRARHARRPGEPGKMPFWHGDRPGPARSSSATRSARSRASSSPSTRRSAAKRLRERARPRRARRATTSLAYLAEQAAATGEVPSDRAIVVERYVDEIGDWRVCILSPFGARVHAPWATAVAGASCAHETARTSRAMWSDDGMVFRLPESDEPPDVSPFLPDPDEIEDLVVRSLGDTSLFAARFRENAARALLLPRRHPGRRSPLWAQRKRSADLLAVPRGTARSRSCWRPTANACATSSTSRRSSICCAPSVERSARRDRRLPHAVAVRGVAAVLLRRELHLRRRRAAGRAPRAGAVVDQAQLKELLGRGGAARAARSRGDRVPGADAPAPRRAVGRDTPMRLHDCCSRSATSPRRRCARAPSRTAPVAGLARRAGAASAASSAVRIAGEARYRRRRGRGPPARRARRGPAAGPARRVSRAGRGSARRSGLALRAHARSLSRRRRRPARLGLGRPRAQAALERLAARRAA